MAKGDCFIKIDGISGEAEDAEHAGCIEVGGWSWGVAAQPGSAQLKTAYADVRALTFEHSIDRASAALLAACVSNKLLRNAELVMRRAGGKAQRYLRIELKNVKVTSVDLNHGADALIPSERVTLSFEAISFDYTPQSATGADRSGPSSFRWQTNRG